MPKIELEQAVPAWTELADKQGLDPLGMQNTSIALYQQLVPGISNVTLRMRVYALHTWLTAEYARAHHSPAVAEWCQFLRRGEALYALIVQYNIQDSGIAGSRWASRRLGQHKSGQLSFAAATDLKSTPQYLKQKFGSFGAAYSSQLLEMGLIQEAQLHGVPVPTESEGMPLALTFAQEIKSFGHLFLQVMERGSVTVEELKAMAAIAPSDIGTDTSERAIYEKLLFKGGAHEEGRGVRRRDTLRLILHTAREIQRLPWVDEVRWVSYSGHDEDGALLAPPGGDDAAQRYRWRVYQANDLTHICHETLLRFSLETLSRHPAGLPLQNLLTEVTERLLQIPDLTPTTWAELEGTLKLPDNAWSEDPCSEWTLSESLLSVKLNGNLPAEVAFDALRLLAVLSLRMRPEAERAHQVLGDVTHITSQTLISELAFLHARRDQPIEQTLAEFLKQRILDRHLTVAFQKLRAGDYTFLFEMDEGLLRFRQKSGAVFTNPRLAPAITFLHDIHLLDDNGITPAGERVLEAS